MTPLNSGQRFTTLQKSTTNETSKVSLLFKLWHENNKLKDISPIFICYLQLFLISTLLFRLFIRTKR
ncbi:MAG: hypothetical protein HY22_00820 [[Candidatus Thermochlorobacteriaceae] bacterium GBChlB]|nr:MAG: hypothetical protein HY22_00820 [[Candidatus Thermochlorobacteriaceae] bacterium GBChlB]